jgi:2,3-bisphosphoglycerate-independent phosphoglycerate mutase
MTPEYNQESNKTPHHTNPTQLSQTELVLINQEHIFKLNVESIKEKLKNHKIMNRMSRFAQNKMRETYIRSTESLEKIQEIKEKYNMPKDVVSKFALPK